MNWSVLADRASRPPAGGAGPACLLARRDRLASLLAGAVLLLVAPLPARPQAALQPLPLPPPLPGGATVSRPGSVSAAGRALDPALQQLLESADRACRIALARRFSTGTESVEAWLVPGLLIAIESGARSLPELRREGLEFGWMVRGRPDPLPIGVCRTDGSAAVRSIVQQPD